MNLVNRVCCGFITVRYNGPQCKMWMLLWVTVKKGLKNTALQCNNPATTSGHGINENDFNLS